MSKGLVLGAALGLLVSPFLVSHSAAQCTSNCIITDPTATQVIAQPNGTTLDISSLEYVLNADQFAGADLCAQASAAFSYAASVLKACGVVVNLPGGQVGPQSCANAITIPTFSCPIPLATPTTSAMRVVLDGHGTVLYALLANTGDMIDVSGGSALYPNIPVEIENVLVYGSGSPSEPATTCGIHFTTVGAFHLHDFAAWGFAPGSGVCVDATGGSSEGGLIDTGDVSFNGKQIRYFATDSVRSVMYNTISNVHLGLYDSLYTPCESYPYCLTGVTFENVQPFGGKVDLKYNFNNGPGNQGAVVQACCGAELDRANFTLRGETTPVPGGVNCAFRSLDGASINTGETVYNGGLSYLMCPYLYPASAVPPAHPLYPQQSGFASAISGSLDTYWINEGGGVPQYRLGKWKNHGGGTFSNYGGNGDDLAINMSGTDLGHDSSLQFTIRKPGTTTQKDELNQEVDQMQIGSGASISLTATGGALSACSVSSGGQNYFNTPLAYTVSGCTTAGTVSFVTGNGVISSCTASGGTGCASPTISVASANSPVTNMLFVDANGNIGVGQGFNDTTGTPIAGGCGDASVSMTAITALTRSGSSAAAILANSITIPANCYFIVEGAYDTNFNGIYFIGSSSFTGTSLTFQSSGTQYTSAFLGGTVIGPVQFPQATLDVNGTLRLGSSTGGSTYTRLTTFTTGQISVASLAAGTCVDNSYTPSTPAGAQPSTSDIEFEVDPSQGIGNGTVTPTAITTGGKVTLHFCADVLSGTWTPTTNTNYTIVAVH